MYKTLLACALVAGLSACAQPPQITPEVALQRDLDYIAADMQKQAYPDCREYTPEDRKLDTITLRGWAPNDPVRLALVKTAALNHVSACLNANLVASSRKVLQDSLDDLHADPSSRTYLNAVDAAGGYIGARVQAGY